MVITSKRKTAEDIQALLQRGAQEAESSRLAKRQAQHQQWMRVMMEGQSTPDLAYFKPKV